LRLSEFVPVIEVGLGVPVGLADADGPGEAVALGAGLAASGVAIGFAGAGFFWDNSATVNFMASLIGIRTTPLVLSTQPYEVSAFVVCSRMVCSFSARACARFFSYRVPRGDAPTTTSASKPKKANSSTTPIHVENVERG
jgi:hypothetical protein